MNSFVFSIFIGYLLVFKLGHTAYNVADIRSFHGTQWSENLGEHLALAKREPDIVLLCVVYFFFCPLGRFTRMEKIDFCLGGAQEGN